MNYKNISQDLSSGLVVFLVAVPLCLGVAMASNAPLLSGVLSGIVGGILVGWLSGSHTSVSGPAAGLTAVVATQIASLQSFPAFLLALAIAGLIQIVLGIAKSGFIADFFPSSVIKGLLAAIGVIIILKQIPHLFGYDPVPIGQMAFDQRDNTNTLTELGNMWFGLHLGSSIIGIVSIIILVLWDKVKFFKKTNIPAPLAIVVIGIAITIFFKQIGGSFEITSSHLVQVPIPQKISDLFSYFTFPDFSQIFNPAIYTAAFTIAIIASLETLLNLEAVDKIDKEQRKSPTNRELLAQGVGNFFLGLIGGIPVTSVVVRGSVNIDAGAKTKLSTIFHGIFLLLSVIFLPTVLNKIPLAALAAILIITGFKLANFNLISQMWREGKHQFLPFIVTILAIVLTDLLVGVIVGLTISLWFILHSNHRHPLRRVLEKHVGADVLRIELSNQVSFFSRPVLERALNEVPRGGHVLIDASNTEYIDPDILDLIDDFNKTTSKAHGVTVSFSGFKGKYTEIQDNIQFIDYSTREVQSSLTPDLVLDILKEGNERFRNGKRLTRDLGRQLGATAPGQYPLAVVLSCIDSRNPIELIFDLGLGDIFSIRIAGNVAKDKVLGSLEFSCAVAGAKLILVLGHTSCGAIKAAVDLHGSNQTAAEVTHCDHLDSLVSEIQKSITPELSARITSGEDTGKVADEVAKHNVLRVMKKINQDSKILNQLITEGKIVIVGGIYDIRTGEVHFFLE